MGREVKEVFVKDKSGKTKKYKNKGQFDTEEALDDDREKNFQTRIALPKVEVPPACRTCNGQFVIGGPIWNRPIHDATFVKRLHKSVCDAHKPGKKGDEEVEEDPFKLKLGTHQRIKAILTGVIDEIPLQDQPLNYDYNFMCSSLKMHNPDKREFIYALNQLGYKAV